jgi:hypothetical protein
MKRVTIVKFLIGTFFNVLRKSSDLAHISCAAEVRRPAIGKVRLSRESELFRAIRLRRLVYVRPGDRGETASEPISRKLIVSTQQNRRMACDTTSGVRRACA